MQYHMQYNNQSPYTCSQPTGNGLACNHQRSCSHSTHTTCHSCSLYPTCRSKHSPRAGTYVLVVVESTCAVVCPSVLHRTSPSSTIPHMHKHSPPRSLPNVQTPTYLPEPSPTSRVSVRLQICQFHFHLQQKTSPAHPRSCLQYAPPCLMVCKGCCRHDGTHCVVLPLLLLHPFLLLPLSPITYLTS